MEKIERRDFFRGLLGSFLVAPFLPKIIKKNNNQFIVGELHELVGGSKLFRGEGIQLNPLTSSLKNDIFSPPEELMSDRIIEPKINLTEGIIDFPLYDANAEITKSEQSSVIEEFEAYTIPNCSTIPNRIILGDTVEIPYKSKLTMEESCILRGVPYNRELDNINDIYWDSALGLWMEYGKFPEGSKIAWDGMKWFAVPANKDNDNSPLSSDEIAREGGLGVCNLTDYCIEYIVSGFGIYDFNFDDWEDLHSTALPSYMLYTELDLLKWVTLL